MPPANDKQIVIVSGASLSFNPRVLKEAIALCDAGCKVKVLGADFNERGFLGDNALAQRHCFAFVSVVGSGGGALKDRARSSLVRCRSKLGRILHKFALFENRFQLGAMLPELLARAVGAAADYYIVHFEWGLWVGSQLIRAGFNVGIEIEDWYSQDLLPEGRRERPVKLLRRLEQEVLAAAHSSCPSHAKCQALAAEYGCRAPAVAYNAFPWSDRRCLDGQIKDRRGRNIPSIHWYSQTLGHGRGLEELLAALPLLRHEVEIHLRGRPVAGFPEWLAARVPEPWRNRIFTHELVPNGELLSRIAEHDVGFAGEQKYCRNKELTVSNKILHYLLAGLAVVASDTEEQKEVAAQAPEAVVLYPPGSPAALAERLNRLLGSAEQLASAKAAALRAAEQTFCWEKCAPRLIESVAQALC